jgi:hypothetical protein
VAATLLLPAAWASAQTDAGAEPEPTAPALLLRGFGNLDFEAPETGTAGFDLGELDMFLSSSLPQGFSVLAEIALEASEEGDTLLDVERLQLQWSARDSFGLVAGRMHTPLGYWNQTFHHGTWLQTTAERPLIYAFEDEGGILPMHEVGVRAAGRAPLGPVRLEYALSFTNGRGPRPTDVQVAASDSRAVNVWVGLGPAHVPRLTLGGALRLGGIPTAPERPAGETRLDERILGGFVAYDSPSTEAFAELIVIRHEAPDGSRYASRGGYLQLSHAFGRLRPYYRFDYLDRASDDPFYDPPGGEQRQHTFGLRFDPATWVGVKLEGRHNRPDPGEAWSTLVGQLAFTF